MASAGPLTLNLRQRLFSNGSNRGNIIGPIAWPTEAQQWTQHRDLKKKALGKNGAHSYQDISWRMSPGSILRTGVKEVRHVFRPVSFVSKSAADRPSASSSICPHTRSDPALSGYVRGIILVGGPSPLSEEAGPSTKVKDAPEARKTSG